MKTYQQLREDPNYSPDYYAIYELGEDDGWAHVDWKEQAGTILPVIDDMLAKHGLEVVVSSLGDDSYHFTITKRVEESSS